MICPHCNTGIRFEISGSSAVYIDDLHPKEGYDVTHGFCSECKGFTVLLRRGAYWTQYNGNDAVHEMAEVRSAQVLYPAKQGERPLPDEVPLNYRRDFSEASRTLAISPMASAALSRRILQHLFHDELQIKHNSLAAEIEQFIKRSGVPSQLTDAIDAIRNVGNFAAHPLKDSQTGMVIEVEPGEAEWLLDVLEAMFDFVFVQPTRLRQRKTQLNAKLSAAGKPPMK
jgi:Domain of unknown function (DUF4145)